MFFAANGKSWMESRKDLHRPTPEPDRTIAPTKCIAVPGGQNGWPKSTQQSTCFAQRMSQLSPLFRTGSMAVPRWVAVRVGSPIRRPRGEMRRRRRRRRSRGEADPNRNNAIVLPSLRRPGGKEGAHARIIPSPTQRFPAGGPTLSKTSERTSVGYFEVPSELGWSAQKSPCKFRLTPECATGNAFAASNKKHVRKMVTPRGLMMFCCYQGARGIFGGEAPCRFSGRNAPRI